MIQDQLLQQFSLLLKSVAPPLIRVTDTPASASVDAHWLPGEHLPAMVLTSLPNGRFQVQVDNQTLEMNLPRNTQPGDQLELVYVGNSPRLTFTLASSLATAQSAAAPLPAALPMATVLPAPAQLSDTAHLLGQLTRQMGGAAQEIVAEMPVLASPPSDVRQLAAALQKTIAVSGLFYESHQAQWVQGEWPLAELQQEPQAQQGQPQQDSAQAAMIQQAQLDPALSTLHGQAQLGSAPSTEQGLAPPASSPATSDPIVDRPLVHRNALSASAGLPGADTLLPGTDPKIAAMLQQQLQLLNTGALHWSGQVWPGQKMQWEISGMPDGQTGEQQQWQTRLNLSLPNLGAISAWLLIGPQGLQVRMQTDQADARQSLSAAAAALESAMKAAGLNLTHFTVENNGAAQG